MTAVARQLSARRLGAGRWRVEFALEPDPDAAGPPPRPHPHRVAAREPVRIESLVAERDRFSVVLGVDEPALTVVELIGDGWRGDAELTPGDEPRAPHPRPVRALPAALDYRARDYDALCTMLLGVVDEQFGRTLADHPVSQTSALIEQIAYLGDALSYEQDAIATEAYLASARRRISVVRHAALLDYPVSPGRSARTWLRFTVGEALELPARTAVLAHPDGLPARIGRAALRDGIPAGMLVFETLQPVALVPDHAPYVPVDGGRLALGATGATLVGRCDALQQGMLVLLEPADGGAVGPGQVVRLTSVRHEPATTQVSWAAADALTAFWAPAYAAHVRAGNLVVADHGRTHDWTALPAPVGGRRYWPELPAGHPAPSAGACADASSAAELVSAADRPVRRAVQLRQGAPPHSRHWTQRTSLLESGPLEAAYVVEVEDGGGARLRFGDGTNGMRPATGATFTVRMRSGGGSAANVGARAIATVVSDDPRVHGVHNPVAATGGEEPESLERVRLFAPRAFRITDRAVTPAEYRLAALEVEGVTDAAAIIVASGSGPVARVRVHPGTWTVPVAPLAERVRAALERRRPTGVALDVGAAIPMAVTIQLEITVSSGWTFAAMSTVVADALRGTLLGPRRFGFGSRLHRSDLVRLLAAVPGVLDVTLSRFGWTSREGAEPGEALAPPFGHIIRIDDDVTQPANGSISFQLRSAA